MNPIYRLAPLVLLTALLSVHGDSPTWWLEGEDPVINPITQSNNRGAANIGQAKWMVKRALETLGKIDGALAVEITRRLTQPQLTPGGDTRPAIIDFAIPETPPTAEWLASQRAPLLIGQLKALATPFYDLLHETAPEWLDHESPNPAAQGQLQLNGTKDPGDPANFYPWTTATADDDNQAMTTIGQLKAVFSLRFESRLTSPDQDADGLSDERELILGTQLRKPDSDGDGIPDGWEVRWGLDPLNAADATTDTDSDNITNLREFHVGTCPTGSYRIEILPAKNNCTFYSAADDGSVVVQLSSTDGGSSHLERIGIPNANGDRVITSVPPNTWNPLETITANLVASGTLRPGDFLIPYGIESSDQTIRLFQSNAGLLVLKKPGDYSSTLESNVTWQAISNYGRAAGIMGRLIAATDQIPEHYEKVFVIPNPYYTNYIPIPNEWFQTTTLPLIQTIADDGVTLGRYPVTHADGSTGIEAFLIKPFSNVLTAVRHPGLGDETIVTLSPKLGRMLGTGPKPFQVCPDGTPILLENLQISLSTTSALVSFASLYRNAMIPRHIASDGRITVTTTDANDQPIILQIIPVTDNDADGMGDDWEKSFAKMLLNLDKPAADWGDNYTDLITGNLNSSTDYTGENITAAEAEDMTTTPQTSNSASGWLVESQSRRNALTYAISFQDNVRNTADGYYTHSVPNEFDIGSECDNPDNYNPAYLTSLIGSLAWGSSTNPKLVDYGGGWIGATGVAFAGFLSTPVFAPVATMYHGFIRQSRFRIIARQIPHDLISYRCLKVTSKHPYMVDSPEEIVAIESYPIEIPEKKLRSDWHEFDAPMINSQSSQIKLFSTELSVDANHDGLIEYKEMHKTTMEKPFIFWVNDDHDVKHPMDLVGLPFPLGLGQEDVNDGTKDCDDDQILSVRDLEDFTRLHLSIPELNNIYKSDETISVGLELTDTTDDPSIKVYRARDEKGGMQYLLDNTKGEAQIADAPYNTSLGTVSKSSHFIFPSNIQIDKSVQSYVPHLIFEGASEGKGKLQITFYKGNQKVASCGSLWIELKNIKKMYQRWNANEVTASGVQWAVWPSANAAEDSDSAEPDKPPVSEDEKDFILFVHGWNMPKDEKRSFAETAFKRMWQIGYKGRFGAFFWPTFYGSGAELANLQNFAGSEQRAWESAPALLGLLNQLNGKYPDRVHLIAHSLGNVVASEALHKASSTVVKNYVSSQAALAADVFKLNGDVTSQWDSILAKTFTGQSFQVPGAKAVTTPNVYAYYYKNTKEPAYSHQQFPQMGQPYMASIGGASKWHNYLNPDDWALGLWVFMQSQKPSHSVFPASILSTRDYEYRHFVMMDQWCFWSDEQGDADDHGLYFSSPDNTYEVFSYCAQARSNPTGRQSGVGGPFSSQLNFSEFGDLHPGHSAQFLYSICERWEYWDKLLNDCEAKHIENIYELIK